GGYSFVFQNATEGVTVSDVTYPVNRAGAASVGIHLGAYHFARPGGTTDSSIAADAIFEADHFLSYAQPSPGDLLPVLDLEVTGGLKPPQLIVWTQAWVNEVVARLGVRPIIYVSP